VASFLRARSGACKRRSRLFSVHTTPVVHCVITPAATALSLLPRGEAPSGEVGAPTRDAPGRVSAVSLCVSEALAALAALALQRALWSHVRLHRYSQAADFGDWSHPGHLRPSRHWYNEVGGGWAVLGGVLVTTAGTQLRDLLDMNALGLDLLPDDALRHTPAQILHQKPQTAVLREREGVETHTLPPSRDRSALTAALKPLAVDGTTISFSAFSWAVRPPGQEARNQARKARVSRTPEIKMGVLLGHCPAGKQVLATWALVVVPSGLSLRGPDVSLDMHLLTASDETADSDGSEPIGVGLSDSLVWSGATDPPKTAAYVTPPSGDASCRLQAAACSLVTVGALAGRGVNPSPGDSPELASSLALRLPVSWPDDRWGALAPPPDVVPRLPASTTGFFFFSSC